MEIMIYLLDTEYELTSRSNTNLQINVLLEKSLDI